MKKLTIRQELLAKMTRSLGNPHRIAILDLLLEEGACYFGRIGQVIPLAKATVSQHLTALKDAGLITSDEEGTRVRYSINKANWKLFMMLLKEYLDVYNDVPVPADSAYPQSLLNTEETPEAE